MADGFLIASSTCFVFALISFLSGSYHIDRYIQLLSLTHQQSPFARATMKIGMYIFVVPAVLIFFAMKLLQIHLVIIGKQAASNSLLQELAAQTGGITLFVVSFGVLVIVYSQVLIRFHLAKKALLYVPGLLLFASALIFLTQSLVASLMLANVLTLGLIIVTYRKLRAMQDAGVAFQPRI